MQNQRKIISAPADDGHPLQVFDFHANKIRVLGTPKEPWFCLSDVCQVLGIQNPSHVASRLRDDLRNAEKIRGDGVVSSDPIAVGIRTEKVADSIGREQETAFVNEPNLYRVIFQSRKAEAIAFQNWVYDEVLPSIRKTGRYSLPQSSQVEEIHARYLSGEIRLTQTVTELVAAVVENHIRANGTFHGYAYEMIEWLRAGAPRELRDHPVWPSTPRNLNRVLFDAESLLIHRGIGVYRHHTPRNHVFVVWFMASMAELALAHPHSRHILESDTTKLNALL